MCRKMHSIDRRKKSIVRRKEKVRPHVVDLSFIAVFYANASMQYALII